MTPLADLPVGSLVDLANQLTATVGQRQEDDDRPPTHRGDMAGLAGLCFEWFERVQSQIDDPGEIEVPDMLWFYRDGQERLLLTEQATDGDFEQVLISRVAEAMALMAEAWWTVQQAAYVDASRRAHGSAEA